jgi:glycosyltransferase involved in cell wall biosynthesis
VISLIVATVGRTGELERLLASLERQIFKDFEVIVVDQNGDDRLVPILASYSGLVLQHLRSRRGLSIARNVGLRYATGDIFAFPDDDCWYPSDLLQSVYLWFQNRSDFDLLSAVARSADDAPVGPNWPSAGCKVSKRNIWACSVSTTIFIRRSVCRLIGGFNEQIGVGANTNYQSGEETDYLLRAMEKGCRMWFEPGLTVHHPPLHDIERLKRVTYPFALGSGYILRQHHFPLHDVAHELIRSFGGAVVSLMKANPRRAHVYLLRGMGQAVGYFRGPSAVAAIASLPQDRP